MTVQGSCGSYDLALKFFLVAIFLGVVMKVLLFFSRKYRDFINRNFLNSGIIFFDYKSYPMISISNTFITVGAIGAIFILEGVCK